MPYQQIWEFHYNETGPRVDVIEIALLFNVGPSLIIILHWITSPNFVIVTKSLFGSLLCKLFSVFMKNKT